jgi:uncharacterized membrane protein
MNRTTTVVVALIAAAGLSTMAYAVPEQLALAWGGGPGFGGWGGCGGFGGCGFGCGGWGGCGGFGGCGFGWGGCGGGFFGACGFGCGGGFFVHKHIIQTIDHVNNCTGDGKDQKAYGSDSQDQIQKGKQVVCLNTAVNSAGHGFDTNGTGMGGALLSGNLGNTGDGNIG